MIILQNKITMKKRKEITDRPLKEDQNTVSIEVILKELTKKIRKVGARIKAILIIKKDDYHIFLL